ncbi:class I tRNA ligase family protein, partial [Candidatus Micrarchaeota archaeon]|nr:class I tRNA ligase family protein [Candidatus Micrarchaeota archaeon]
AGFDCHGLPVEVIVEKELGVQSKREIEESIGIKKFDETCLNKILNNERVWMKMYENLGAWRAFFEPYFTYKNYYIESAWWTLKRLHEKGFLTRGLKPIHWCPHCETALSGYEVSDSYKNVTDPSIFIKFPVSGKKNEFLLVWTTTPWTLVANVAVAAHPTEEYVRARVGSETLILAKKLAEPVLKEKLGLKYEIVDSFKGTELDGLKYEPVLSVPQQRELDGNEKARRVYLSIAIYKSKKYKKHSMREETEKEGKGPNGGEATRGAEEEFEEFVTMEDGTGLVHCAPGHGQSDYFLGEHYGLPAVSPVDERGCFTEKAGSELAGKFVKAADKIIIERLESEGKLLHFEKVTHSYPLCWRCKSPLVFRLSDQWYLKIDSIKDSLIEANSRIKWMPPSAKEAEHNWLVDANDWCVSQQRFWGIPMPVWVCGKCGPIDVIGSVAELREKAAGRVGDLKDLHRHSVDEIELNCACGGRAKRVKDIFNVWFDSSIAPWASLGYPQANKELFEQVFPVHLIDESQDQIRGWFYALLFSGMAVFGKPAFEKCGLNGWVVDEKGEKMSKSLGNVVS